ncbi:unnamed protein product [marine sediment metagenome]|uniref:PAS domain-containing protein n=1 Tax=marine sediment metagenome TaxID=412755 RepID=X1C083_9ZZZZ
MLELAVLVLTVLTILAGIQIFAKWQVGRMTCKAKSLNTSATDKLLRFQKLERLASDKLSAMSYAESIANFSTDCIAIMDPNKYLYVNPKMLELLGYTREEMIEKSWVDFVAPDDKAKSLDATEAMSLTSLKHFIVDFMCKDGHRVTIWWTTTKQDENGVVYAIGKDISQLNGEKQNQQKVRGRPKRKTRLEEPTGRKPIKKKTHK